MMEENKKQEIFACNVCNGSGNFEQKVCGACLGVGIVVPFFLDSEKERTVRYLYWSRRVDSVAVYQMKVQKWIKTIISFCFVFIGLSGVFVLLLPVLTQIQHGIPLSFAPVAENLVEGKSSAMLYFWITVVVDLFLVFLLQRSLEKTRFVFAKEYDAYGYDRTKRSSAVYVPIDWQEFRKSPKNIFVNVADAFSREALSVVEQSWILARNLMQKTVEPIHCMAALLLAKRTELIFARIGVSAQKVLEKLQTHMQQGTENSVADFPAEMRKIFIDAYLEAYEAKQRKIDVDELLIALAQPRTHDLVNEILFDFELSEQKIRNVVVWFRVTDTLMGRYRKFRSSARLRSKSGMDKAMTAVATPFLNQYSVDLTLQAKFGNLQPLMGRDREVDEILRIIAGGSGSVLLYGQAGVGKTAIVEGIAQRMVEEDVPKILQDKRMVSLSVAQLVGGASVADAEERMLGIIHEIRRAGNIVLFIDNIQGMVGVTVGGEGSLDLSQVLAASLQKHEFIAIATAPEYDFHRNLETNTSIGQVLHKVKIEEMSNDDAILVLEAKVGFIELKNKTYFSYGALAAAVNFSDRYMHESFLPTKALNLIEEASVYVLHSRGRDAVVSSEDIAHIVAQKTNIPVTKITEQESQKLLNLEDVLHERMVNQVEAVSAIAASLRRARAEFRDTNRPIANFLFLGPTGVGKTELAKTVAQVYFGNEESMIRVDMSEYQQQNSLDRLIGALPSSGGKALGGYLTDAVRKNPYSLILFDEIEKAHPEILNLFLQVMDDGRLTDATGRTIDFTQTIIIMTSNACTSIIQNEVALGTSIEEIKHLLIEKELKRYFRPEFLNRFDSITVFKPLTPEHVRQIARLMLQKVGKQLEDKGILFEVTDAAVIELARNGFDPLFGARPLRRVIQEDVNNVLANALLSGELSRRDTVVLEGLGKVRIVKGRRL